MKVHLFLILLLILIQSCVTSISVFELNPKQSMSITGLGIGQDAANNPYSNGKSLSIIENIGKTDFIIRVQDEGVIIEVLKVKPEEVREVILLKGYALYLDSELKGKAKVLFKKHS